MKFNIAYLGPEHLFHLRRDFILAIKFGLEELGHQVFLSGKSVETQCFNLLIGAYFLPADAMQKIATSGVRHAHINTEVIANDMLNFNPKKTDFIGAYLPAMRAGSFTWDVLMTNMPEHHRYENNAFFLRWGWCEKIEEISQNFSKDLDFYFFGMMTPRRVQIVNSLAQRGFRGIADGFCPYFLRNDRIARAKVNLNLIQDEKYTHVNNFRLCYLANNRSAIISEPEQDPAGYLSMTRIAAVDSLAEELADLVGAQNWKREGERAYETLRKTPMKEVLGELLDISNLGERA
jgi:hypothetical protein